jgi:ribosome maturation factor RimP
VREDIDELEILLASTCAALRLDLYDVELRASTLSVTVDRQGGLDLDAVAEVARILSAALDEHEALVPAHHYDLEVSSPGLERPLRKPRHFESALGSVVAIRLGPGVSGQRRFEATLLRADDSGIEISDSGQSRHFDYADIERAHMVFDWKAALSASRGAEGVIEDLDDDAETSADDEAEMTKEQA